PGRGELSAQGIVDDGSRRDRLDAVVGPGAHLIVTAEVFTDLRGHTTSAVRLVGVGAAPTFDGVLGDPDGTYREWLTDLGAVAVLVRPDFYVYGSAATAGEARTLAEEFDRDLRGTPTQSLAT
ncbi:MAG TPA: hypothetical protein VGL04_12705, partial [Sporichthyaceae bacterium]